MLIIGFTTLYRVIKTRDVESYSLITLGRFWVFRSDNHEYDLDGAYCRNRTRDILLKPYADILDHYLDYGLYKCLSSYGN